MRIRTVMARGVEFGAGPAKICVPVVAYSREELEGQLALVREAACDLIEFRADYYLSGAADTKDAGDLIKEALLRIREVLPEKPLLFTLRTKAEGGAWEGSKEVYRDLAVSAAAAGLADLVDLEYLFLKRECTEEERMDLLDVLHSRGAAVILSSHDFSKTPGTEEMTDLLRGMQQMGADITKMAVMPRTGQDVIRLMEVSVRMAEQFADRPYITISMGQMGMISRIGCSLTGSCITFASAGTSSAPGQLMSGQLRGMLKTLSCRENDDW